jgi:hypothetical protein
MEIIKHISCNNRVKLEFIPIYSIINYNVNSIITIKIQQTIQLLWQYKKKIYSTNYKKKKPIDFRNEKCLH